MHQRRTAYGSLSASLGITAEYLRLRWHLRTCEPSPAGTAASRSPTITGTSPPEALSRRAPANSPSCQRRRILRGHAHGMAALLGVVNHEYRILVSSGARSQKVRADEMMQLLLLPGSQARRHRLNALPLTRPDHARDGERAHASGCRRPSVGGTSTSQARGFSVNFVSGTARSTIRSAPPRSAPNAVASRIRSCCKAAISTRVSAATVAGMSNTQSVCCGWSATATATRTSVAKSGPSISCSTAA
jgi:hypothetical protein